jgi:putative tricarboxylic transport membrane protein
MEFIRRPKDFFSGLLFLAVGISVFYIASDYSFGSARRMGPGFFPRILAGLLIALSLILLVRGVLASREGVGPIAVRAAFFILGGSFLFTMLLRPAGLVPAILFMVVAGVLAQPKPNLKEGILLALVLSGGSAALFVYALGQNVPLLGYWFTG